VQKDRPQEARILGKSLGGKPPGVAIPARNKPDGQ
jgi:hypothetical protein